MTARIRPLQRHDLQTAIALFTAAYPERSRETETWAAAEREAGARRWVATAGAAEQAVGYGSVWPVRPNKFRLDLIVHPVWRRQGIGSQFLAHLSEYARDAGAETLQARAEDQAEASLGFLRRNGFSETMRMHRLLLDVARVDLRPFAHLEAALAAEGVVLTALGEEQAGDPAAWDQLCDLYNAAREGWPDPDPGPDEPLTADELRDLLDRFAVDPKSLFIAKGAGGYLGFTGGVGTAVRPAARNRGIATALKVRAITEARARGQATLRTASGSPAMIRVNEKLGFRQISTEVRLVKRLGARIAPERYFQ
jgi:mycothiol synthase